MLDRDPIFTSSFWQILVKRTRAHLNMCSAYHRTMDGQTEQVNQQVEGYLRSFISSHRTK